jgi:hypothetical protein
MRPSMSVFCGCLTGVGILHDWVYCCATVETLGVPLLEHVAQQWEERSLLEHFVGHQWPQVTLMEEWRKVQQLPCHSSATMIFVIWRKEHLWNVSALRNLTNLVL